MIQGVTNFMDYSLKQILRFRIAFQTIKDNMRSTIILTFLFSVMAVMYTGIYPAFKDMMQDMMQSAALEQFSFIPGYEDMASYVGFLNIEMYQIFYILILGIIIGFIAASIISKEIESKTIDLLMSNPVSRKQIVFEKFLGLIPMMLIINFVVMFTIIGMTVVIDEELNFWYLFLTHVISIFYFLAVIAIGVLISTVFNEKMKSSITMMAVIVGMFILDSVSQTVQDYKNLGLISLKHYYNPYDALKFGEIDFAGTIVLFVVTIQVLVIAMIYFEHKDIQV
jgi:ABC-2 type transport system permease protein